MWANSGRHAAPGAGQADPRRVEVGPLPAGAGADPRPRPGYRGLLTYTLPESLWLAEHGLEDLVVAYPTADRTAIAELARRTADHPDTAPVLMVDSTAHLDLIEEAAGPGEHPLRVAIELDVNWWALGGRVKVGPEALGDPHPAAGRRLCPRDHRPAAAEAGRA